MSPFRCLTPKDSAMINRMWIVSLAFLLVATPVGVSLPFLPWLAFCVWLAGQREMRQLAVIPVRRAR